MPVETRSYVDQEIRTLVDGFAKAVREKNLDALMPLSKAASTTRELTVVGNDDVAFSHSLNHVAGRESR
jgi:ketosteroid isomerase-like protein